MNQVFNAMILVLATRIFGFGCAAKNPSFAETPQATPPLYVECIGEFVDLEPDYPWFEDWIDPDGNECHDYGRSPRAVFRITSPPVNTDRNVGILYKYEGKDLSPSPDLSEKGKLFSFELPEDFLNGGCETIDNIHVKNIKIMP